MNRQERIKQLEAELEKLRATGQFHAVFRTADERLPAARQFRCTLDLDGDIRLTDEEDYFWLNPEAQNWLLEQLQRAKRIREGNDD